ncbi:MAG: MFS transporter [Gammaproteobacteria bacterium]|nr:MFS transporter [Gammaproteobacteria bacterium]
MPRPPESAAATRWFVVSVMIASGVAASLHVGKVPPALPALRDELDLGLVAGGWVASIFNLIGATLGIASGLAADRLGVRRVLAAGLVFLAAGSVLGATADSGATLLATRVLSGLGLVTVAVAAPGIIVAVAPPRDHGLALGAWSIYMPAGMAIAMLSAPLVLPGLGWRGLWLFHAGLTAIVLVIVLAATRGVSGRAATPRRISTAALRRPGPWLLAAAFGCYTVQFFAVTTWMPTFLVETYASSREIAALAGAFVVAANIAGCLAGAWLLHRDVARWKLLAITYLVMTPCAAGAFAAVGPPMLTVALAATFSAVGGLLPAAILAGTAVHAPSRDHVATVNGFVVQGSHVGVVVGPPVFAMFVANFGSWEQGWILMAILGIAGLGVTAGIRAVEAGHADCGGDSALTRG